MFRQILDVALAVILVQDRESPVSAAKMESRGGKAVFLQIAVRLDIRDRDLNRTKTKEKEGTAR